MPSRRALLSGAATTGVAAVAGCSVLENRDPDLSGVWREVGRDRTNRSYASDVTLPGELAESWRANLGSWPYVPPVIDDGTVYAAGSRGVFAFDAGNGGRQWHRELDGEVAAGPAVADDVLVVPEQRQNGTGGLLALDREQGTIDWGVPLDSRPFAPSVTHGHNVYARTREGCVWVRNGELRWRTELDRLVYEQYNVSDAMDFTATVAPAVGTAGVVVPVRDGIAALDLDEGTEYWRVPLAGSMASPVVADGSILAVGVEETLAVDHDGNERWRTDGGGWATLGTDGREVYVLGDDELAALSMEDGERTWNRSVAAEIQRSQPAVLGDAVLAVNDSGVAYRRDDPGPFEDRELLQFDGATDHGGVAVGAGRVVVVDGNWGDVVAFEPA